MLLELLAECQKIPFIFFRLYLATFKETQIIYNRENEKKCSGRVSVTYCVFFGGL